MASALQPTGKAHLLGLSTGVDLVANNIKLLFYSAATNTAHEFVSDLTGGSIIARSGNLAGKTVTAGTFDANDITISAVTGAAFTHVWLYKDSGADATSVLIGVWDVASFAPNGSDVLVTVNASGFFAI